MCAAVAGKELLDLERKFWDAIKNRDKSTAARLTDDDCIVVGPSGAATLKKDQIAAMIGEATYELQRYDLDRDTVQIRAIGDDVAVVAYKVSEKMVVEGKPVTLDAYDSSVWVRRDGTWACALHTETIAGDPFGRK